MSVNSTRDLTIDFLEDYLWTTKSSAIERERWCFEWNKIDHDFESGGHLLLWNPSESPFPHLQNGHICHTRLVHGKYDIAQCKGSDT